MPVLTSCAIGVVDFAKNTYDQTDGSVGYAKTGDLFSILSCKHSSFLGIETMLLAVHFSSSLQKTRSSR